MPIWHAGFNDTSSGVKWFQACNISAAHVSTFPTLDEYTKSTIASDTVRCVSPKISDVNLNAPRKYGLASDSMTL